MSMSRSPERFTFSSWITDEDRKRIHEAEIANESDSEWCKYNLEYDLRTTDWILEKVRSDKQYAQALYAALCNNDFQKLDTYAILADIQWVCSWRAAGGIVANMCQTGDYIDFYPSGENAGLVSEGGVSENIEDDLLIMGWKVIYANE